ncbi:hypothetical protein L873DRAFT_936188 [Choiromyces venosus 120613-1]|uniref:Uncharacterized protein n=1 Tax=Choiromyces venosus 120613-1 TaxID=1336337 RepID=A0A3N4JLW6_9PEZI|nr:hypothetical protein L873DRAFT_936188 [Choiromyces venosus 120613-1]
MLYIGGGFRPSLSLSPHQEPLLLYLQEKKGRSKQKKIIKKILLLLLLLLPVHLPPTNRTNKRGRNGNVSLPYRLNFFFFSPSPLPALHTVLCRMVMDVMSDTYSSTVRYRYGRWSIYLLSIVCRIVLLYPTAGTECGSWRVGSVGVVGGGYWSTL